MKAIVASKRTHRQCRVEPLLWWWIDTLDKKRGLCQKARSNSVSNDLAMHSNTIQNIYQDECPPSILRSEAVMKLLASLIKNTAAPLYCCGTLSFPSIFCLGHSRRRSGNCSNNASTMAVTIYPGERVLTRMPYWPHSEARFRASWSTPALLAL